MAADHLQRGWIGIDINPKTVDFDTDRIQEHDGAFEKITACADLPLRTEGGEIHIYHAVQSREIWYGEHGGNCNQCGHHSEARHLEVDQVIARSQEGTDDLEDLQLLCANGNPIRRPGDRNACSCDP